VNDTPSTPEPSPVRPPTDLRKQRRQTERNLVVGGFVLMFVVGGGAIWYLYGVGAMFAGWLCLGGGAGLLALLYGILKLMEIWSSSDRE
jgi:hypothetical protein